MLLEASKPPTLAIAINGGSFLGVLEKEREITAERSWHDAMRPPRRIDCCYWYCASPARIALDLD